MSNVRVPGLIISRDEYEKEKRIRTNVHRISKMMLAYIVTGGIGVVTIFPEDGWDVVLPILITYFALPFATLLPFFFYFALFKGSSKKPLVWSLVWAGLVAVFLSAFSVGYVNLINAFWGQPELVIVEGPIVDKKVHGLYGGSRTNYVFVVEHKGKRVEVSSGGQEIFERYRLGDIYRKQLKKGSLGYDYTTVW